MKARKLLSLGIASAILASLITLPTASAAASLTPSFSLDFEGKQVSPATYTDGSQVLVTGGDAWTGSGNWSLAKAGTGYSLDGQALSSFTATGTNWDNINVKTKLSDSAVFAGFGGSYTYGQLRQSGKLLTDAGDDVFVGLTSSMMRAEVGSNQINYDDIAVAADPADGSNKVLKIAPPVMENSTNTGSSLFGKNYIDVVGKKTTLSSKVYIDQEAGGLRLMLVRDVDFLKSMEHALEYGEMKKGYDYMSWLKKNGDGNPGYWYDAVRFEDGVIYLDGVNVGTYAKDTWYTVSYALDLTDIANPAQTLEIKDASGNAVVKETKTLTQGGTSTLPNISQNAFALSEDAQSYGLVFAATSKLISPAGGTYAGVWNGNRAQSGTVAYLDDVTFGDATSGGEDDEPTDEPADEPSEEVNEDGITTAFGLDFEKKQKTSATYTDGDYTLVTSGDAWTGSANWSLAKAAAGYSLDGQPLSEFTATGNKWDDMNAKVALSDNAVISGFGGSYTYGELKESGKLLTDKGAGIFVGLTSSLMPAVVGSNQINHDDIAVVADPSGAANDVLKMAPPAMENDANVGSSLFGKNYIDVVGKSTKLSSKVYIDQEAGGLRLMLVRDVDFLMSMEHALEYGEIRKTYDYMSWLKKNADIAGYWYDAVRFEDGVVYLDGKYVADYESDSWYTVDYYLDLKDLTAPMQALEIKDASGTVIVSVEKELTVGGTSTLTNISQNAFALSEEANSYGLVFAATSRLFKPGTTSTYGVWNGNRAQSGTVAYLDDITFEEGVYEATEGVNSSGLTTEFDVNFEGKVTEAVTYQDGDFTLVTSGDAWTGSGNWSLAKAGEGYSLDGQKLAAFAPTGTYWDNTNAKSKLADSAVFAGFGGSYTYGELRESGKLLTDKGTGIFVGLTSSLMPALVGSNQTNYDDIAVVADPENENNSVLKMAPPAMENDANTGSSLFGKNYIDVVGKSTKLSSKVYIDQEAGGLKLMLVRDVDFLKSMEHALEYAEIRKGYDYMSWLKRDAEITGYWYDAVRFEDGVIYLDGENAGTYITDTWYNVDYYLDLTDITSPVQVLEVKDTAGAIAAKKQTGLTVGGTSALPNISQNAFALSEDAQSYGLVFAATSRLFKPGTSETYSVWNGNRAQSATVAYLDDVSFGEAVYEEGDITEGVIELVGSISGGKYSAKVINGTDEAYENAMLVLAAYDNTKHSLLGAKMGTIDVVANGTSETATLDVPAGENCYYKAFVWDSKTFEPVCDADENVKESLKILAIGNSFTENSFEYLYQIAEDYGIDDIVLGNVYAPGCSIDQHWSNATTNAATYTYQKNSTGTRVDQGSRTMLECLQNEDWDIIVLNIASHDSGIEEAYKNVENLAQYVNANKTNDFAKFAWHMTWAYAEDSTHPGFANYDNDQMTMYNSIINAVQNNIPSVEMIDYIIPAGTTIQNLRASTIGDNLDADGYHLNQLGCYASGMTWFHKITGYSIDDITYVPSKDIVSDENLAIVKAAVKAAVQSPYQVTEIK